MKRLQTSVFGLFDNANLVEQVLQELKHNGIKLTHVQLFSNAADNQQEDLLAQMLAAGASEAEANPYAQAVVNGRVLLLAQVAQSKAQQAYEVSSQKDGAFLVIEKAV